MKARQFYLTILIMFAMTMMAMAQPGPGRGEGRHGADDGPGLRASHMNLPDLTDAQKEKMNELRTANMKVILQKRNQVHEKMSRLQTLQTAEKADMKAINSLIDQMAAIKADMARQRAAHRQQVRALLTDEQRVIFDSRPHREHRGEGKRHFRKGRGQRNCPCAE